MTTNFRIVNAYPHDPEAFTEGLLFANGFLYESTGLEGKSSLRKIEVKSGKVLKIISLPNEFFGEGLAFSRDRLVQLTWRSRVGFVYDMETFRKLGEFRYSGEGWGLAFTGDSFVMSDGSAVLRFLDGNTFTETRRLRVTYQGKPVLHLNELEYIRGEIFANIWLKDVIVRISPQTGVVLEWIDLSSLRDALGPRGGDELNGIAYNPETNRIFVTGKRWPKLFEIELVPGT